MRFVALASSLLVALVLAAGCTAPSDDHADDGGHDGDGHMMMGPGTYHMRMAGLPSGPMAPGHKFNITVHAEMGSGMETMRRTSDHIGAHFWNRTMADPTAGIGNSTACQHAGGELPGTHAAQCTAPTQPGTYHIRAHARIMDNGTAHHWWGDEHTFTVS